MEAITSPQAMQSWSERTRLAGQTIALVPTMGALHGGHLALVGEARRRAGKLVVSLFVNPLQFNQAADLATYPRDLGRDAALLEASGLDVLFAPSAAAMYPEGFQTAVEVERVTAPLCGRFRPGHFRGVATVVTKLFNLVRPHIAVFGEKDFQQLVMVRRLVRDLDFGIEVVAVPTYRDEDGLASSSRNARLTPAERAAARRLPRALARAARLVAQGERGAAAIVRAVAAEVDGAGGVRLEYAEIRDPETLEEVQEVRAPALLAVAAWVGEVRLIDNIILQPPRGCGRSERLAD